MWRRRSRQREASERRHALSSTPAACMEDEEEEREDRRETRTNSDGARSPRQSQHSYTKNTFVTASDLSEAKPICLRGTSVSMCTRASSAIRSTAFLTDSPSRSS